MTYDELAEKLKDECIEIPLTNPVQKHHRWRNRSTGAEVFIPNLGTKPLPPIVIGTVADKLGLDRSTLDI